MIKIKNYSESQLSDYLQSYSESQLKLNINHVKGQEKSYLQAIENSLGKLVHLQELEILVKKNCILFEMGYLLISNSIQKLVNLTKLTINIGSQCYLDNSGLITLANSISHLSKLKELVIQIQNNNFFNKQSIKYVINSIKGLKYLAKIQLQFVDITNNIVQENISVWSDLHQLQQLEELTFSLNFYDYHDSEFLELFDQISLLKNLQKLQILLNKNDSGTYWIDKFIYSISQLQKLKILIIDFDIDQLLILNNSQVNQLYFNISNLKLLEELQLNSLEEQLIIDDAELYFKFLGGLNNLTKYSLGLKDSLIKTKDNQIMIGQCLKQLSNIIELNLTLGETYFRFYDEFIIDLSEAIKSKSNLNKLCLNLISYISQFGFRKLGESLEHLNKLETFICIFYPYRYNRQVIDCSLLLYNIRFLTSLKHIVIQILDRAQYFDYPLLFGSMEYLINVQTLGLQLGKYFYNWPNDFQNINVISSLLKKITKLDQFKLNIQMQNLNDQKAIEEFIEAFQSLKSLNKLTIGLQTAYLQQYEFEIIHILKYLENIKILYLYITLQNNYNVNSLADSITNLKSIETLFFYIQQDINSQGLIQILSALKKSTKLQSLHLKILLDLSNLQNEQFSAACFHLQHLQVLKIEDLKEAFSKEDPLLFYSYGIKELINLTKLSLNCKSGELTDIGAYRFALALNSLSNLRVLKLELNCESKITQKGERFLSLMVSQLKNLKKIKLQIKGIIGNQIFDSSLGLDKLNKISISSKQNQKSLDELENNDSQEYENIDQELMDLQKNKPKGDILNEYNNQVTQINLNVQINQNQFSQVSNLKYLSRLNLQIKSLQLDPQSLNLDLFNEFSKLNRLNELFLTISNIKIERNTIEQINEGFKYTSNIQFLFLNIQNSFDSDYLLMEGISYLKNLYHLKLNIPLSDQGAVSLGKSLSILKNLKKCEIKIEQNQSFSQQGVISIENGLKNLNNLVKLNFMLSELATDIYDNQTPQLGRFLFNMKRLDKLKLQIGKNNYSNSFGGIEVIKSLIQLNNLIKLKMEIDENNQIDSENVGGFLEQLSELKNLKKIFIKIVQQQSQIVLKSKFAIIFNKTVNKNILKIKIQKDQIEFKQTGYDITIKSQQEIQMIGCEFFKSINKSIPIELQLKNNITSESEIYNTLKLLNFTDINISFKGEISQETYQQFCDVIPYWQNTQILKIKCQLSFSNEDKKEYDLLSEKICELKSLYILKVAFISIREQYPEQFINMINILSKLQQLQEIEIHSSRNTINEPLQPIIKNKFKKLIIQNKLLTYIDW